MSEPNKLPLISICLPVYNGGKHLAAALESILAQTFNDYELLIADDGSTDGSIELAESFAKRDGRIRFWKNSQRQGLFGNYNACIKEAKGKYIKTFAQDDVLMPDALACMKEVLEKEPTVALVSSSRQILDDDGNVSELKQPIKQNLQAPGKEVICFHLISLNNWVGEPSTVMFRREHAGTGFDAAYYHYGDIEYWFRILINGDFYYFERPLSCFRRHAASQTDKNHRELFFALDILRLCTTYRHMLADIESVDLFKRRVAEKISLEHGHVLDAASEDIFEAYQKAFITADGSSLLSSDAAGFRLLASLSLSTISELIKELDHEKRCRAVEQERFAAEVEKMQNSIYYKLASPLRKVKDAIKGNSAE